MRIRWAALVALLLFAFGCQPEPNKIQPPKVATKVASLSPSLTEIVTVYGRTDILVGRTASCNYPPYIGKTAVVMSGIKPDYEKVASVKPELVVYDSDILSEADMAKFQELGIPTFGLKANDIDEFERELFRLGSLIGTETRTSDYVDKIEAARALARVQKPQTPPTVAIVLPGSGTEHMVAGTQSFLAKVFAECGARVLGPESAKFEPLNAETLIQQDPDFVFVAGEPALFLQDARFKGLKAIRERHLFGLNPDVALRKGSRLDTLIKNVSNLLTGR
ncbi:MAG: helical backbone metal receptor [Fimbriimonadales bacterium]|nr:helical backbone metal receptor [Fimbriimonadales bacterium]